MILYNFHAAQHRMVLRSPQRLTIESVSEKEEKVVESFVVSNGSGLRP